MNIVFRPVLPTYIVVILTFREFEQQRELRERGLQSYQNSPDESSGQKVSSSEISYQIDKV